MRESPRSSNGSARETDGKMRIVIDTNVLISSLLNAGRVPDRVLHALRQRKDVVLYDDRIVEEYRSVLARPKFRSISTERSAALIDALIAIGQDVGGVAAWQEPMVDPDDRMFVEVALRGRADVLLTGNARHYPKDLAFDVLGPTELLERLESG